MKALLLTTIKLYWKLVPAHKRNKCLFKETCSVYVYKKTTHQGFISGLKALWDRYSKCRSDYTFSKLCDGSIQLADGTILAREEVNERLLFYFRIIQD